MENPTAPVAQTAAAEEDSSFGLSPAEVWWRDQQLWLQEKGYLLRPRYKPGWVPPWRGTNQWEWDFEDSIANNAGPVLDAVRISTKEKVALKRISRSVHPYEIEIGQYFSAEPLASHPKNHCIPLYDVLDVPNEDDTVILVMPLLRRFDSPRFNTVGEAVEFFRQVFEGLQFMHQCRVAHRDCMDLNIMMDPKPIFPNGYHPSADVLKPNGRGTATYHTRTARPTRYYLIDFGLSRKYAQHDTSPREYPIWGGDKTVPEFQHSDNACDPFPTDIYYIGNMIRESFLQQSRGLEFMAPLMTEMVKDDPSQRPTIDEVVRSFKTIQRSLSWFKLRSRLVYNDEGPFRRVGRSIGHTFRTFFHVICLRPAVPVPPTPAL